MSHVWQSTPIYIVNRNRLDVGFRPLVEWLNAAKMLDVTVIDNASTYEPLLEYYKDIPAKVWRLEKNVGPWVFWNNGYHESQNLPYVVADGDCVPAEGCPKDLIRKMAEVMARENALKVGAGIKTDNLPECYAKRDAVLRHEEQFSLECHRMPAGDAFDALIDTTMAIYPAKSYFPDWCRHFRLAEPYVIEHRPWYSDTEHPTEEEIFYKDHAENGWSNW